MKKLFLFIVAIALFAVGNAQEIHVKNATEFLRAIGSNRTIIIEDGAEFNLTEAILSLHENYPDEYPILGYYNNEEDMSSLNNKLFLLDAYDGPEVSFKGVSNLTIKGGNQLPLLLADPRYAYVFSLYDCNNITFENVIMGHTNLGYCEGGVVALFNCNKINFIRCDLFGCGTQGIGANNVDGLNFVNSHIHDCTYYIMTLNQCKNCNFTHSLFFNNEEFDLVNISGKSTANIRFKSCQFFQNKGQLFNLSKTITLEDCYISHPSGDWGTTEFIQDNGTRWTGTTGYPYDEDD